MCVLENCMSFSVFPVLVLSVYRLVSHSVSLCDVLVGNGEDLSKYKIKYFSDD